MTTVELRGLGGVARQMTDTLGRQERTMAARPPAARSETAHATTAPGTTTTRGKGLLRLGPAIRMSARAVAMFAATLAMAGAGLSLAAGGLSAQDAAPLELGRTLAGSLMPGDTARYAAEVGEEFFVLGEVNQISVAVSGRMLGPDGEPVGRFGTLGRGVERFGGRTEEAGTYTLELFVTGASSGNDEDDEDGEDGSDEDGEDGDAEDDEPATGAPPVRAQQGGRYEITLLRLEPVAKDPEALADQLMARFDGDHSPGAAVRAWRDGRTIFSRTYGMANLAYGIPFEEDTRTNIGSTSKQFTAFAVMLQAERGLLSLDDDIRTHIPELPKFDETIQVRHLITHTSGLREFLNLLGMTGRRLDRGDWIDRSELIDIVQRQPALQNEPGGEWNYNNTAFGLAAVIVERTSGQDFHVFMEENVFAPLGMAGTMVRPSVRHIVPNMSEGYTPAADGYSQIGDLGGAVGAGSIYSTIGDLQRWVENFDNPTVGTRDTFDEMMTSFVLNDGEETGYGYGLSVDEQRGLKRVSHGGADVAHRSMLIYYPEINGGLTTQSNHAQFSSGVAGELAEAFFEEWMEEEEDEDEAAGEFDPESYDPEAFDELAGRYALDAAPNFILTFMREDGTFYTQATGQQRVEMVPTSDSTFRLLPVDASVTFHRNDDGEVDALTLHQNGDNRATRLPDEAEAWAPSEDDLEAFTGRYFSEEIETHYTIALEDGELVMRQRRLDPATLSPGEEDRFSGGNLTFAFERDRNGQVIGFYLSNVRTRDVRFARVP